MTYVLLPVSKATYDELAEQVRLRGQPDRVDGDKQRVYLTDVVVELNESLRIKDEADARRKGFI